MQFEEALKVWGANKLREECGVSVVDLTSVQVEMEVDEGYACCGGTDPHCYCSYAESPSAKMVITSGRNSCIIKSYEFDFATVLGEIVKAGNGTITE